MCAQVPWQVGHVGVGGIPLLRERIFPEHSEPPLLTHQPGPLCGVCMSETFSNPIQKKEP